MLDDRWQQRHHSEHGEGVLILLFLILFFFFFLLSHLVHAGTYSLCFTYYICLLWMDLFSGVFIPFIPLAAVFGYELLHD